MQPAPLTSPTLIENCNPSGQPGCLPCLIFPTLTTTRPTSSVRMYCPSSPVRRQASQTGSFVSLICCYIPRAYSRVTCGTLLGDVCREGGGLGRSRGVRKTEPAGPGRSHGGLSPHDNPLSYTKLSTLYRRGNRGSEMSGHLLKATRQVSKSMRSDLRAQGLCVARFRGTRVVGKTPALSCLHHPRGDGAEE